LPTVSQVSSGKHFVVRNRSQFGNDPEYGEQKAQVANAVHDEGFVGTACVVDIFKTNNQSAGKSINQRLPSQ
jgi:hypothetical protein